jgi:hypothetical protein
MAFRSPCFASPRAGLAIALLAGALVLGACATGSARPAATPAAVPHHTPHPAIAYDRSLGVHVLKGVPDSYLSDGRYLRFRADRWEVADDWDGPWRRAAPADVPAKLKRSYATRTGTKGPVPAKGSF